jgi:hypothetical protein
MKAIVSVSEMAGMVGLSRARFYQLVRSGIFPPPVYYSGRPVYTAEMQAVCLEVRRSHRGANGKPILFYARRPRPTRPAKATGKKGTTAGKNEVVADLLDGLNALGLTTATAAQVERATKDLFPQGTNGLDQGDVLKRVFLHLKNTNGGARP